MSEHNHEPLQDLENFSTAGIALAPLLPSEVRRLGDRRRAHRRNAVVIAASVVAVLAVAVPVALTRDGDDAHGSRYIAKTPSPTPTPAVITYPGTGVEVSSPADVDKLTGTSSGFQSFIADQVRIAVTDGATCPDAAHGVTVQKYSSAGYAIGGVNSCGGYVALWVDHNGQWQEGQGTQDAWDCATLTYFAVPRSFAGDCANEASGLVFGPTFVGDSGDQTFKLRLGMSEDQIVADGGSVQPASGTGCVSLVLPYQQKILNQVDGYVSPTNGLVAIFARPGMKTPKDIGLGSTLADLRAAYPAAREGGNGYWVLPVDAQTEYEFGIEESGIVGEMVLTRADQDCFG